MCTTNHIQLWFQFWTRFGKRHSPIKVAIGNDDNLRISALTTIEDILFAQTLFEADCKLILNGAKLRAKALLDTGSTGYAFINANLAKTLIEQSGIKAVALLKP